MTDDITSILLPSARVDFFALDDGTAESAGKLSADWRFARVGVQVTRAGIEAAIAHYAQHPSPEMIVIETNDISDAFIGQLGGLAGVCAPGTDAVIIGPMNDVHLYRSLVGMGVRDYLVRPVREADIVSIIAKALVEKKGLSGARLISVLGSKGGVGATSVAQILAWNIAENLKQKTILMDAAGSTGSVGISFGVEPATTLTDGVRVATSGSEDDLKRIVQHASDTLSLLVFGGDSLMNDLPDADSMEALVNRLMQKSPIVVLDLSGASPSVQKRMLTRSTHVVLVSTPVLPALRNARSLIAEIKTLRNGLKELDFVINMQGMAGSEEVNAADIVKFIDYTPSAKIAHMPKAFAQGEATGKAGGKNPLIADAVKALMPVAQRASGKEMKETAGDADKKQGGAFGFLKNIGKKG